MQQGSGRKIQDFWIPLDATGTIAHVQTGDASGECLEAVKSVDRSTGKCLCFCSLSSCYLMLYLGSACNVLDVVSWILLLVVHAMLLARRTSNIIKQQCPKAPSSTGSCKLQRQQWTREHPVKCTAPPRLYLTLPLSLSSTWRIWEVKSHWHLIWKSYTLPVPAEHSRQAL